MRDVWDAMWFQKENQIFFFNFDDFRQENLFLENFNSPKTQMKKTIQATLVFFLVSVKWPLVWM